MRGPVPVARIVLFLGLFLLGVLLLYCLVMCGMAAMFRTTDND